MDNRGRKRLLLASVHDVSPRFESEVDGLADRFERTVGHRFAMLVVPNHWHTSPVVPGSPFATRLRRWSEQGVEMFLHGFFHRDETPAAGTADRLRARYLTAGEGEFLSLDAQEAGRRIARGRSLIEDVTGRPVAGFVAPAWLYGKPALAALEQSGIALAEDHWRVWSPGSGATLATGPVITWATRTRARLLSSLVAAAAVRRLPARALRVGVHPPDIRSPAVLGSIDSTFREALRNREPASYADLLS